MAILKYSFAPNVVDESRQTVVEGLNTITKMALNKNYAMNPLAKKYSVVDADYAELNKQTKEKMLKYCADATGVSGQVDVSTKEGLVRAFTNSNFEWTFFAIQTEVLGTLLADTEVEAMAGFVSMNTVGLGDSKTFFIGSKALYDVEDASYGNRVTRPRKQFKTPVTIAPTPKEASVQFDVVQLLTNDYDFGAEMAKIVVSIRTKQYADAVAILFNTTPLVGTPFYKAAFNLANYTELSDRLGAVNNASVMAYGTRQAFATASGAVTSGFAVIDEAVKNSYINDLFGIPSRVISQSVDTSNASFNFRVPNDRIILVAGNTTPIQMVQENYMSVEYKSGETNNVMTRSYKYIYSYEMGLATADPYAIQAV